MLSLPSFKLDKNKKGKKNKEIFHDLFLISFIIFIKPKNRCMSLIQTFVNCCLLLKGKHTIYQLKRGIFQAFTGRRKEGFIMEVPEQAQLMLSVPRRDRKRKSLGSTYTKSIF